MDNIKKDEHKITKYQRLHIVKPKSEKILKIFQKYVDSEFLKEDRSLDNLHIQADYIDELKNSISHETNGFDLVNLLDNMCEPYRTRLLNLFSELEVDKFSKYRYKIMIDIDNTTVENKTIAPIRYQNGEIIPGLLPILYYFSGEGLSTTTFLSARPNMIEITSIHSLKKKIPNNIRFSILTGTINPILVYLNGKIMNKHQQVEHSYQMMAEEKYQNFMDLFKIYPKCKYIFMGDDTQGDAYLAHKLLENVPDIMEFTAIRLISGKNLPDQIRKNKRIIFHQSYYQLAYKLIKRGWNKLSELILKDYSENYSKQKYHSDQVKLDQKYIQKIKTM